MVAMGQERAEKMVQPVSVRKGVVIVGSHRVVLGTNIESPAGSC